MLLVCVFSRIPQLSSGSILLDGDESVVALMAKHFGHDGEFPLYFWGQTYGFSFIEVLTISLFYKILGVSALAVQCAMLSLWSLAIICFYRLMRVLKPDTSFIVPFLICLVLILNPAFAVWALKARGGYLSAFLLSQLFLYLLFRNKKQNSYLPIVLALLSLLIFESQSLWLAGLVPYLAYYILSKWSKRDSFLYIGSSILFYVLLKGYKSTLVSFWEPEIFPLSFRDWEGFLAIPKEVLAHFSGSYLYSSYVEPSIFAALSSWIFLGLILVLLVLGIRSVVKTKFRITLEMAALLSLPLAILYLIIIPGIHPRYLLPLIGYVLLSLFILTQAVQQKSWFKITLIVYLPIGLIALLGFKKFSYDKPEPFYTLIEYLEEEKIDALFSESGLLQWQVMFYTNEEVKARYRSATDRYPAYVEAVNKTHQTNPSSCAIIGKTDDWNAPKEGDFETVASTYFLFRNPKDSLLKERGFLFASSQ